MIVGMCILMKFVTIYQNIQLFLKWQKVQKIYMKIRNFSTELAHHSINIFWSKNYRNQTLERNRTHLFYVQ